MTFVTCGPFAEPEDELNLLLIDDALKKKGTYSCKNLRLKVKDKKNINRANDNLSTRGLTTSQ